MKSKPEKTLVIGAGLAFDELYPIIKDDHEIIGLIDDNKTGTIKGNLNIIGKIYDLDSLIKEHSIEKVFVAMPSAEKAKNYEIWKILNKHNIKAQIIPDLVDILSEKVEINMIKKGIEINDIVGRPLKKEDILFAKKHIEGKVCMVTGAAGSIGSELVHQLAQLGARKVVCFDRWENGLFYLNEKLSKYSNLELAIGDIQDKNSLNTTIRNNNPDFLFHAAAYKHVGLMECHPREAFKNNVFGTRNIFEAAVNNNVPNVILVSTDKAINPTSIMGGTKRIAEKLMEIYSRNPNTKISAVRFGNVVGSEGSVFHVFQRQIEAGLPITITHKDVTRYMMTIPEAVQLIIQSSLLGENNEIFLLDMGDPMKMTDFLSKMLELKGISISEVEIRYIGLRKGEKLHEEIILDKNTAKKTHHDKIWVSKKEEEFDYDNFLKNIEEIESSFDDYSNQDVTEALAKLVPNFQNEN